jgi:hypothetical protein
MYTQLFKPVLNELHPCLVEEIKHHKQKEHRILDTLEILMGQHNLVIDYNEVLRDFEESKEKPARQLFYQMTRLSRDKGSLQHDDRIDVLAMGCAYWREQVESNREREYLARRQDAVERGCREFMAAALGQEQEDDVWVRV